MQKFTAVAVLGLKAVNPSVCDWWTLRFPTSSGLAGARGARLQRLKEAAIRIRADYPVWTGKRRYKRHISAAAIARDQPSGHSRPSISNISLRKFDTGSPRKIMDIGCQDAAVDCERSVDCYGEFDKRTFVRWSHEGWRRSTPVVVANAIAEGQPTLSRSFPPQARTIFSLHFCSRLQHKHLHNNYCLATL